VEQKFRLSVRPQEKISITAERIRAIIAHRSGNFAQFRRARTRSATGWLSKQLISNISTIFDKYYRNAFIAVKIIKLYKVLIEIMVSV
jgi:hypothetical protein